MGGAAGEWRCFFELFSLFSISVSKKRRNACLFLFLVAACMLELLYSSVE